LKVVHLITTLVYGGAERLLCNMSKIHAQEFDIEIIYLKDEPNLLSEFPSNVKITYIPLDRHVFINIRNYLKQSNPKIFHTHLGHADFIGLFAARNLDLKRFCTMHNIWFKWDYRDKIIFSLYKLYFKTVAKDCKVISISEAVKRHVDFRLKVNSDNSILIYNGIPDIEINKSRRSIRESLGRDESDYILLFVGRLRVQKSVADLIMAVNLIKDKIPNLKVLIVGDGPEKTHLETMIVQMGLEHIVSLEGTTPNPEYYFEIADIFVLPSVFEGLGLVILEAFRAGVPVIATNIEGPKELITNSLNGILVEPKDYQNLSEQILSLYSDPERAVLLGERGFENFRDKFNIATYADSIKQIYLD